MSNYAYLFRNPGPKITEEVLEQVEQGNFQEQASLCSYCAHLNRANPTTCKAFPDRIPFEVQTGQFRHYMKWADEPVIFSPMVKKYDESQPRDEDGKWVKVGHQQGSNPGGVYTRDGVKHYVKFPHDPEQVRSESLADRIHEVMGVQTVGHKEHSIDGKPASVSEWKKITPFGSEEAWSRLTDQQAQEAANTFMASALVKNWDLVGLAHDNMGLTDEGKVAIVDTGGSFRHRAQGGPKEFGPDAEVEIENFLNPEKTSGRVYGPLFAKHPEKFKKAALTLNTVADDLLSRLTKESGIKDHEAIAANLHARKRRIMAYFDKR